MLPAYTEQVLDNREDILQPEALSQCSPCNWCRGIDCPISMSHFIWPSFLERGMVLQQLSDPTLSHTCAKSMHICPPLQQVSNSVYS